MSKPLLNSLDWNAVLIKSGCIRVSQAVESDVFTKLLANLSAYLFDISSANNSSVICYNYRMNNFLSS